MTPTTRTPPRTPPGTPALHLQGLTKRFGAVTAVDGLDLRIEPGEVVAFLGPNGAGKTTTLDIVLGLSRPTAGHAHVLGLPPARAVATGRIAAVLQTGALLPDLTVLETVQLIAGLHHASDRVTAAVARAGLEPIADRRVGRCSGGEQQRLRFALALLPDPDLLVLDEPTTGMDVETRRAFWHTVREDADQGRTVVFATHYLDEADAYADRIVLVSHGRVVADGTTAQIRSLGGARTVTAAWAEPDLAWLARLPGVLEARVVAGRVHVEVDGSVSDPARTSDAVARALLGRDDVHDLQIATRSLEDAFVALTGDDAPAPDAAPATAGASGTPAASAPSTSTFVLTLPDAPDSARGTLR